MVPLGHYPILEIIIRQLTHHGFRDIVLSVGYMAELIQAYFDTAKGKLPDVNLDYVKEQDPKGTAGSLALIDGLDETFLVMNGDILTSLDYGKLIAYHRDMGGTLTIAMHKRKVQVDFGVIQLDDDSTITGYMEKPEQHHMVSMGIYVYEPRVLEYIEPGAHLDFPALVLKLLENDENVVGYHSDDYWLDIGRHQDYERAQTKFEQSRDLFLPDGGR